MVLVCGEQDSIFRICAAAVELSACTTVLLLLPAMIVNKNN